MKPSSLDAAIAAAGVKTVATLFQHSGAFWRERSLFHASFSPPGQLVDNEEEVVWIGCRTVPAEVCGAARAALEHEIIPAFIAWIKGIEGLPMNSPVRREKQEFEWDWQQTNVS